MTPSPGLPPRSGTGLFLLSGGLLALALLAGLARDQHWGEPTFPVLLDTDRAEGLRTGMAVRIAGLSVGTLRELTLKDNARVAMRLEIAERHRRLIGPGSVAWHGQEGFVGELYVGITPRPLPPRSGHSAAGEVRLPFEPAPDLRGVMHGLLATQHSLDLTLRQTRKLTSRAGEVLPPALASAQHTLGRMNSLATSLQREATLTGPPLRNTLQQAGSTAAGARGTVREAELLLSQSREPLLQTLVDLQRITAGLSRLLVPLLSNGALDAPGDGGAAVRQRPPALPPPGAPPRDDPHPRMPPLP